MAQLDVERERLVIRIVYDGPARAGKTTSVKALAAIFGKPVWSSEDADGRTLHFDWMEYEGGRFERFSLCCQVLTVPGQPSLAPRRLRLLESADAVVFVVDSRRSELGAGLAVLDSLRDHLRGLPAPPPGIILQANKRDAPEAETIEYLRDRLAVGETIGVMESIASEGTGIRQTFVFAVRLALDRVAELMRRRELAVGAPEVTSGPALLAALEQIEVAGGATLSPTGSAPAGAAAPIPTGESAQPAGDPADDLPRPPTATLPTGRVWPPVEGRQILHEAGAEELRLKRLARGDWVASTGRWALHASASAEYPNVDEGRNGLIEWARWHAGLERRLSPRRCVALVEGPRGTWRLWQVLRRERTFGLAVEKALQRPDPEAVARTLLEAARALQEVHESLSSWSMPVTLDSVGLVDSGPAYVGLAPTPAVLASPRSGTKAAGLDVEAAFRPALARAEAALAPRAAAVRDRLTTLAGAWGLEEVAARLAALLPVPALPAR